METMRAFALALASLTFVSSAGAEAPGRTFRVEQLRGTEAHADEVAIWLVSVRDPSRRARLPEIPLADVDPGSSSGNIGYESELSISPDERFIFRDQKLYHGANAAYLYVRVRRLTYRPGAPARVDRAVKRFFARQVGGRPLEQMGIVEFVAWSDDGKSLVASLRGRDVAAHDVLGWRCTIDLASGRVSLTEAQKKANAGTFVKSEPR
jgi:hypothetical protein